MAHMVKESVCDAGDLGSVPGLETFLGQGSGVAWRLPWIEKSGRPQSSQT